MKKEKPNNIVVCIICGILTAFGIVASIISSINGSGGIRLFGDISYIVDSALIFYYAFYGYQRPHGNLLKFIILIFAATRLISVFAMAQFGRTLEAVNNAIIIGLLCYMAGRLHRVKQNMIIMIIVAILIVLGIVLVFINTMVPGTMGAFTSLIIWIDICVAYVLRFREHHLAGLEDALKN